MSVSVRSKKEPGNLNKYTPLADVFNVLVHFRYTGAPAAGYHNWNSWNILVRFLTVTG